jgi:xanthine dehydrogenase YagS FAD-binding subunit
VLGAVSSLPWRAVRAEQVLVGDRIDEGSAESVAQAAVEDASPLSMNAYKVDIVRALVKRAILGIPI